MLDANVLALGKQALLWFEESPVRDSLAVEFDRLFGAPHERGIAPLSPCAAHHVDGPAEAIAATVAGLYRDVGFTGHLGPGRPSCPCHVANELEFVSYCLDLADEGLTGAAEQVCEFVGDHLFAWGIVFSAAVIALTTHPVLRFAGVALEGLLFCEARVSFEFDGS
jgi:TorA maturation chaperone TorD